MHFILCQASNNENIFKKKKLKKPEIYFLNILSTHETPICFTFLTINTNIKLRLDLKLQLIYANVTDVPNDSFS